MDMGAMGKRGTGRDQIIETMTDRQREENLRTGGIQAEVRMTKRKGREKLVCIYREAGFKINEYMPAYMLTSKFLRCILGFSLYLLDKSNLK